MKKFIGLAVALTLLWILNSFATDLPNRRGEVKSVHIFDGSKIVAEVKIFEPGKIEFDSQTVALIKSPQGNDLYVCKGGVKLRFFSDGQKGNPSFLLSGEKVQIENIKSTSSK